jgi:hypothetical protein
MTAYSVHVLQVRTKRFTTIRIRQLEMVDDFVEYARRQYEICFAFDKIGVNVSE